MIQRRTMGVSGEQNWKKAFYKTSESDFSSLYFNVVLQYNVKIATICCQGYCQ